MDVITSVMLEGDKIKLGNGLVFSVPNNLKEDVEYILRFPLIAVIRDKKVYVTTALLHLHTGYSLLDGAIKIKDLVKKLSDIGDMIIKENGMELIITKYPMFCANTDHGSMFGGYSFSTELEKEGLFPIIGAEVYLETIGGKKDGNHLILLCKDETGYHNLCLLISEAEKNFYNRPHVTWDLLRKHSEGLVCLSACLAGEIPQKILKGDIDGAIEVAENFIDIFEDDFYIEIQNHHIPDEDKVRPELVKIAKELGVKMIATTDAHYLNAESKKAHEVLLCIGTGTTMTNEKRFKFEGTGYHVFTNKEMIDTFSMIGEAVSNQLEVVQKCKFRFKKQEISMPLFPTGGLTTNEAFRKACWDGFEERFGNADIDFEVYKERLEYEISVISQMKFEAYFLIVADFIKYARDNGIGVGPGRGSAVGSLVAYCLKITNLDPIPYGLLFERFLNPERVSMPDIDIDFQDTRRQEVIDYVKNKYGEENVSRIITFGTLAARAVIRDVGRAMEMPLSIVDKVAKAIPAEPKMTIDKAFKTSLEFQKLYADPKVKQMVDIAKELEGLTRHKSQHACGVVISARPVYEFVPEVLLTDSDGNVARTAAFTMTELEDLGLLKMDFLGLRNMGIINNSLNKLGIKEDDVPLNDPYVYAFISTGDTDGIFQIESGGMKSLMKDMFLDVPLKIKELERKYGVKGFKQAQRHPEAKKAFELFGTECFERLIAAISLYRPGPMDYIPQYIAGMRNPKAIHYDTPKLKGLLEPTYGTIVYQEQVQQIVRDLAGYSLGRGDLIRRAMGKKKADIMNKEREIFIHGNKADFESGKDKQFVKGCVENGVPEEVAIIIWDKMAKFAEYAFNKSHAAGYAVIAIITAWLKYYYPTEFWVETLNSVITKADKLKKYIGSAKLNGVEILNPNINTSQCLFSAIEEKKIRMGLTSLRNLGKSALPIVEEREANGSYTSFDDFVRRIMPDKRMFESLVYSGTLDEFEGSRASKIRTFEQIVNLKEALNKHKNMWFEIPELTEWYKSFYNISISNVPEMEKEDKLEKEYLYAGMYVSEHPLDQYVYITDSFPHSDIAELVEDNEEYDTEEIVKVEQSKQVTVVGIVKEFESKLTKKGDTMYVFKLEDTTGEIRTTVFPREVKEFGHIIRENAIVRIDGLWKNDDFGIQVVASNVVTLTEITPSTAKAYSVYANRTNIGDVLDILDKYSSKDKDAVRVEIVFGDKRFVAIDDRNLKKRAVKVEDSDNVSILKISPSLEAYSAIRKVTKIERK